MKRIFILFIFFSIIASAFANEKNTSLIINSSDIFNFPQTAKLMLGKSGKMLQSVKSNADMKVITLNSKKIEELFASPIQFLTIKDFPITPTENKNIILEHSTPIVDANTEWWHGTANGPVRGASINISTLYGSIEGIEGSKVCLNYTQDMVFCYIDLQSGERYLIAPVNYNENNTPTHLLLSERSTFKNNDSIPYICYTEDFAGIQNEIEDKINNKNLLQSNNLLEAGIAVEATNDFFVLVGSDYNKAAAYIASVMALSSKIYEEQVNVRLYIPYVLIWEDANLDPYKNTTNLAAKLYKMPNIWKSKSVDRSLAVLFASVYNQPSGTTTAGISFGGEPNTGSLCSKNRGYCVFGVHGNYNYPTLNYTWDVNVATHEMGHNFSAPHTHNCYFQPNMIDTCITQDLPQEGSDGCVTTGLPIPRPGTIMSYCHLTNSTHNVQLIFHDRIKPLIRTAAEKASCVVNAKNPIVSLLNPLGDKNLKACSYEQIRWTSALINYVTLKYSSDNGVTWNLIIDNYSATNGFYDWVLPDISSNKMLVLIHDKTNTSVADTSLTNFSILKPELTLDNPVDGDRFGQKETVSIRWEKVLVDSVYIEFSSDGGNTWVIIQKGYNGFSFDWEVPDIENNNCLIRIRSSIDNGIISESGKFAIGKESGKIIFPNGGETLCVNKDYEIVWVSDFVSTLYIEYTVDNGINWRKVRPIPLNAKDGRFLWTIPEKFSSQAFLKITSSADRENPLDLSDGSFIIDSCSTDINDIENNSGNYLKIIDIVPNPATNDAHIKILNYLSENYPVVINLIDEKGAFISQLSTLESMPFGEETVQIKIPNVAQGNYYILIKSNKYHCSTPLKILK